MEKEMKKLKKGRIFSVKSVKSRNKNTIKKMKT